MALNTQAMQIAQTVDGGKSKVRNYPSDTNIKQLSRGSWLASLSKGGQPSRPLKGRSVADFKKGGKK